MYDSNHSKFNFIFIPFSVIFLLNKDFKYRNEIKFYSNNEYINREELQSIVESGF
jgi:hypothetical protein